MNYISAIMHLSHRGLFVILEFGKVWICGACLHLTQTAESLQVKSETGFIILSQPFFYTCEIAWLNFQKCIVTPVGIFVIFAPLAVSERDSLSGSNILAHKQNRSFYISFLAVKNDYIPQIDNKSQSRQTELIKVFTMMSLYLDFMSYEANYILDFRC